VKMRHLVALFVVVSLCTSARGVRAEDAPPADAGAAPAPAAVPEGGDAPVLLSPEALEELMGPVALYPDIVLSSLLPATAYPMQVVMAARYVKEKGGTVTEVPEDKGWDASVAALLQFPEVLAWLDENPEWMEQVAYVLSNQQAAALDAIQSCRKKTKENGSLATNEYVKVEEVPAPEGEEGTMIVVESADPEVVYVPTYDYSTISSPAYVAGPAYPGLAFGAGVAVGAVGAWAGYELGWWGNGGGGGDADISINNEWNRNTNVNTGDRNVNRGTANGGAWKPPGPAGGGARPTPTGWAGGAAGAAGAAGWGNKASTPVKKPTTRPATGAGGAKPSGGGVRPPSGKPGSAGKPGAGAGARPPSATAKPKGPAPSSGVMNGVGGKADSSRGKSSLGGAGGSAAARPSGGGSGGGGAARPSTAPAARPSSPSGGGGSKAKSGGDTYKPSSGSSTRAASSRGSSSTGRSSSGGGGGGRSGGGGGGRGGGGGGRGGRR